MILQKGYKVALGMVGSCSMDNVFFLKSFVGVVQILIDSLVRATKFPRLSCPDNSLQWWMILKSDSDQRTTHFAHRLGVSF